VPLNRDGASTATRESENRRTCPPQALAKSSREVARLRCAPLVAVVQAGTDLPGIGFAAHECDADSIAVGTDQRPTCKPRPFFAGRLSETKFYSRQRCAGERHL